MTPHADPGDARGETLEVQVAGGRGEPERLLVLGRPRGGAVPVREFRFGDVESGPRDYTASAAELLADFQRARRQRRRLSEDLYAIRRWLDG